MNEMDLQPVDDRKGRGRPRLEKELLSSVSVRLPQAYHDRLIQLARLRDESVSATVRSLLILRLR